MASLRAHFVRPEEHDRLSFHPQCPRCRAERLEGALSDGPLVPLRAQAAIAVGVLACTSLAPTAAFATGVGDEIEGTAAPGQLAPDIEADGELDATGESEAETTEQPAAQPSEPMPTDDTSDEPAPKPQSAEPGVPEPEVTGTEHGVAGEPPAGAVDAAAPPSDELPPTAEPAADEAPAKQAETARAKSRARARDELRRVQRTAKTRGAKEKVRVTTVALALAPAPARAPAVAVDPTAVAAAPAHPPRTRRVITVAASSARAAEPGDKSHVVQRGESLWSIAADIVGDDASPMRIAREVNRLWELNESRIGTGDRDLLMAGTRLTL